MRMSVCTETGWLRLRCCYMLKEQTAIESGLRGLANFNRSPSGGRTDVGPLGRRHGEPTCRGHIIDDVKQAVSVVDAVGWLAKHLSKSPRPRQVHSQVLKTDRVPTTWGREAPPRPQIQWKDQQPSTNLPLGEVWIWESASRRENPHNNGINLLGTI